MRGHRGNTRGAVAAPAEPSARIVALAVVVLTLVAAALRLWRLGQSPPGLVQDEATNAWNAYCLLKTGCDMAGARWPIFYTHGFGGSPTVLLPYLMVPFLAIGGLGVASARLAPAVSGILCVPLLFYVGCRLFGRTTGLVAAALLVLNPWHLSATRWAMDGSVVPFLTLAQLAALLAAGLPFADGEVRPRPGRALFAGLLGGAACYGYWAVRLQFPVLLALAVLVTAGRWRVLLRSRRGRMTALAFALGLAVTFGPLVHAHLTDPAVGARGAQTRLCDPGTPLPEIAWRVVERYAIHFGPDFLFRRGDEAPGNSPADSGMFEWALLPLLAGGAIVALRRARGSASGAFLLAMVLAWPFGDVFARYDGVHAFRSTPGIAPLLLLAAVGGVSAWRWLRRRGRLPAWGLAGLVATALLVQDARSLTVYFGEWPKRPAIYSLFHTDFMQACEWVRPRLGGVDAVFWTADHVNMPFVLTLVGLRYEPARWLGDARDVRHDERGWDCYVRYGRHYFLYGQLCRPYVEAMQADGRSERVLFVVRPHELGLTNPVYVVRAPDGTELIWVCEGEL